MTLSEVKSALENMKELTFKLPHGALVPSHFHITEVGTVQKKFIDCGGTLRNEQKVNFQLWSANDFEHRLAPKKLQDIIQIAEEQLGLSNAEVEVEYQGNTIETYGLELDGDMFLLKSLQTDCLAPDKCGIPAEKPKVKLSEINANSCCDPNSGCC